jgi:hypothetical protein
MSAEPAWRPNLDWVAPDLAIGGSFPAGVALRLAREHGVGAVIDVRRECCDDVAELAACGVEFLHLPTQDLMGVSQPMLDRGVEFAARMSVAGRRLLIHCEHGIGRSALVGLCVLVHRGHDPLKALLRAKDAREQVSPSQEQYEAWAAWLRRRAPQASVPSFHEFGCIAYRHLAHTA